MPGVNKISSSSSPLPPPSSKKSSGSSGNRESVQGPSNSLSAAGDRVKNPVPPIPFETVPISEDRFNSTQEHQSVVQQLYGIMDIIESLIKDEGRKTELANIRTFTNDVFFSDNRTSSNDIPRDVIESIKLKLLGLLAHEGKTGADDHEEAIRDMAEQVQSLSLDGIEAMKVTDVPPWGRTQARGSFADQYPTPRTSTAEANYLKMENEKIRHDAQKLGEDLDTQHLQKLLEKNKDVSFEDVGKVQDLKEILLTCIPKLNSDTVQNYMQSQILEVMNTLDYSDEEKRFFEKKELWSGRNQIQNLTILATFLNNIRIKNISNTLPELDQVERVMKTVTEKLSKIENADINDYMGLVKASFAAIEQDPSVERYIDLVGNLFTHIFDKLGLDPQDYDFLKNQIFNEAFQEPNEAGDFSDQVKFRLKMVKEAIENNPYVEKPLNENIAEEEF